MTEGELKEKMFGLRYYEEVGDGKSKRVLKIPSVFEMKDVLDEAKKEHDTITQDNASDRYSIREGIKLNEWYEKWFGDKK